jgi:ankyrin repeat protein
MRNEKQFAQVNHLSGAIAMNKTKLVKILAEGGIDVSKKFNSGLTPIVTAIVGNNTKIVKILLDNGPYLKTNDSLGRTVFHQHLTEVW